MEWIPPRPQWREGSGVTTLKMPSSSPARPPSLEQRPNDGGAGHGFRIDVLPSFLLAAAGGSQVATQQQCGSGV